ncbi:hypothetical protein MBOU_43760 [Mycobacterium bourgelatii]|uniref:PE domain-containing protein n=1 Tax=Mycobacterium bourgelatii TaxID=1273442 RepID=A0A7I9YUG2_MYCBU|nr:hypothetical protein MBOU_43760 [Mycobacterium bourgelatii]
MSFVSVSPELLAAAAADLTNLNVGVAAANAAAADATTVLAPAAADEVSVAIATFFGLHGQSYRGVAMQMEAYHAQFVSTLRAGIGAYAYGELVNAQLTVLGVINTPTQVLLGRPLIGDGANATTPGGAGGAGGLLYGNGGAGAAGRRPGWWCWWGRGFVG